MMTIVLLQG